jgi:DNA-binding transcriptional LysR family regulator
MDIRQLRHFVALVETGTAHAAADDQHISQPGLSSSIKRLENQLGVSLFVRRGRGLVLNAKGKDFYPHAKRTLEYLRLAQAELKASDSNIRIGLGDIRSSDFVGQLTAKVSENYPTVTLEFCESHYESIFCDLEDGVVDIAFVPTPTKEIIPSSLNSKLMTRSYFSIFSSVGHPLEKLNRPLKGTDLQSYPWMFNSSAPTITPHLPILKERPGLYKEKLKVVSIDSLHMGKELVINSDCLCHLPDLAMAVELSRGKVIRLEVPLKPVSTDILGLRHREIRSPLLDHVFALGAKCFS